MFWPVTQAAQGALNGQRNIRLWLRFVISARDTPSANNENESILSVDALVVSFHSFASTANPNTKEWLGTDIAEVVVPSAPSRIRQHWLSLPNEWPRQKGSLLEDWH